MTRALVAAALCVALPVFSLAEARKDPPPAAGKQNNDASSNSQKAPPPAATKTPPGLAKKTGLPPGLAKKFEKKPTGAIYVAFDPKKTDCAWLLIDGKWKYEEGFDKSLRGEVKASLALPPVKPPVPLPDVNVKLQVVKFD